MKKLLPFLFLVSCSPKEVEEYNFGQCLDVSNTSIFKKAEAHEISRRSQLKIVSFHSNGGMGHGTGTYLTYKDESYIITAAHVIRDADFSGVIFNKEIYWVEPLVVFTDRDIAILRVATIPNKESVDLKKVKVAKKIEIGDRLVYTGYPNLTGPLTIFGTVAGHSDKTSIILQSYAWGGASGSLILNEKGELVGILSGIELAHTESGKVENETIVIADIIPQELRDILDHVNTN